MNAVFLVALPISPKVAFLAFNHKQTAGRIWALRGSELIEGLNLTTVQTAEEYVYATGDQQQSFIAQHLREP